MASGAWHLTHGIVLNLDLFCGRLTDMLIFCVQNFKLILHCLMQFFNLFGNDFLAIFQDFWQYFKIFGNISRFLAIFQDCWQYFKLKVSAIFQTCLSIKILDTTLHLTHGI
jgi:hypothetical protein